MVSPIVDEIAEPIVEAGEQVIASVVGVDEDIAMMFGDDNFKDDDFEGFDEEDVWEVNEEWLMAFVTPPPMPAVPSPSIYEVEDLNTCLGNLEYGHGQLVKKVIQVNDVEVAVGISVGKIGLRVFAIEGHVQTKTQRNEVIARLSQQVQALQEAVQRRDTQIQQLHTIVSKMSSREITLMLCIIRMDRRLTDLKRRPPGPQ
uniref:Uncharacterized protein n=1 Tax=Tanacetum cinerariifolium TaxID=118510 RepID=A0A6L2LPE9_TANCI|nr:hypothetical protein [Tanacetum cinerariifolium]